MTEEDLKHAKAAIAAARQSRSEDARAHPLVGVVVVTSDGVVTDAFRGERGHGDHAEYTVLEKKLPTAQLSGATVYTTLEPCTTRNHPKVACAARLIERRVRRVVIGMLDPNPNILGRGVLQLREAGIEVDLFPHTLMLELEELNRDFRRAHPLPPPITTDLLSMLRRQSLDDWYQLLNVIYWNRNYQRDSAHIFTHLVEVVGSLSILATKKRDVEPTPEMVAPFLAKALAWWLALCGEVGITSVQKLLWTKFPSVCPYCRSKPHDQDECTQRKAASKGPDWSELERIGSANSASQPRTIADWQQMFATIYPSNPSTEEYSKIFAKLSEEMGELAEAIRVFSEEPGYFLSEAADVFAWLMKINNLVENKVIKSNRGELLQTIMADSYPSRCRDCNAAICACPPILRSTIGRIAHEVPTSFVSYEAGGIYLSPEKRAARFGGGGSGH